MHSLNGNEGKRKRALRFQFLEIPFPGRFHFYLGGNENAGFVSNSVSLRFLFPLYRRETRNEALFRGHKWGVWAW